MSWRKTTTATTATTTFSHCVMSFLAPSNNPYSEDYFALFFVYTPAVVCLVFVWCIFHHPLTFISLSLNVKQVSCRQHIAMSYIFNQLYNFSLLNGILKHLHIIIDAFKLKSTKLLYVLYFFHLFGLCFTASS